MEDFPHHATKGEFECTCCSTLGKDCSSTQQYTCKIIQIWKTEVDNHDPERRKCTIPHCELVAKWMKKGQEMNSLEYPVDIIGTEEETFFTINIDPTAGIQRLPLPTHSQPLLQGC
jgi:hypothetical protein